MLGYSRKQYMRVVLPLILIFTLCIELVAAQDVASTPELTAGDSASGTLAREGDTTAQVYSFAGNAGDNVRLTATSEGLAMALVLTDASGQFISEARDIAASGEIVLAATLETSGTYYVTVLPVPGITDSLGEGSYSLTLETAGADNVPETTQEAATPVQLTGVTPTVVPETTQEAAPVAVTTNGMQVALSWNAAADLDLEVRDPLGNTLFFDNPVVETGGTFGNNVNAGCEAVVNNNATEQASWSPGGIPVGSYEILIYYQQDCNNVGGVDFTLTVSVDGQAQPSIVGTLLIDQVFITSYEVGADATASLSPRAGVRGDEQLPASATVLMQGALPIQFGTPIQGTITNEQPYQSFSFQAPANDIVTVTMNANSGNLDPYLALIDPTGNVIYTNDDAAEGVTDSVLTNSVLPVAGTYTIVSSRYGLTLGGTEGDFTVAVTSLLTGAPTAGAGTPVPLATSVPLATQVTTQTLPEQVTSLQLPEGSIEITLVWNSAADLQLLVRDPAGDSVFDDAPQIRSGGRLGASGNVNCTTSDTTPVSYVYWPDTITPRAGSYEIDVWFQSECNDTTPVNFTLYATVANQPVLTQTVSTSSTFLLGEHFVTSFTINSDGTVVAGEGGIQGIDSINWQAEAATAGVMEPGDTVNGSITPTNVFDLYAFDGLSGDVVTIAMTAAAGTNLDAKLYLIGPDGTVVSQNDDAVAGENTDSLINNFTLPEDGQYIIIATHYGDRFGVTTGTYTLSLDL